MKSVIISTFLIMLVWLFPARWGAEYFFPEVISQFGSKVPWIMAWGAVIGSVNTIIIIVFALVYNDD